MKREKQLKTKPPSSRSSLFLSIGCGLFAFLLYLFSHSPTIGLLDSGLFAAAAVDWGIPFPPGFPTYTALGHVWSQLPLLSPTFSLFLLSALASAVTVGVVYWIILRLLRQRDEDDTQETTQKNIAAMTGAFSLAIAYQFWSAAITIETFALTNLVMSSAIVLATKVGQKIDKGSDWREVQWEVGAIACLLIAGAGLSPTFIFLGGAMTLWLYFYSSWLNRHRRQFIIIAALTLLSVFTIYASIAGQAKTQPYLNWGNPQTLTSLLNFLGAGDFSGVIAHANSSTEVKGFHGIPSLMGASFAYFLKVLFEQFNPLLFIFIIWGGWSLWRFMRKWFWLLMSIIGANVFFEMIYFTGTREFWAIPSILILAVFSGIGVYELLRKIRQRGENMTSRFLMSPVALFVVGVIFSLAPLVVWFPKYNRASQTFLTDFQQDLFRELPPNSVIIGNDNFFEAQTAYTREVLQQRRDVGLISLNLFYDFPWYREQVTRTTGLQITNGENFWRSTKRAEQSSVIAQLLRDNPNRHFFITPIALRVYLQDITSRGCNDGTCHVGDYVLLPHGLLFQFVKREDAPKSVPEFPPFALTSDHYHQTPFFREELYNSQYQLLGEWYGFAYEALGDAQLAVGDADTAIKNYLQAAQFSNNPEFLYRLATAYEATNQLELAKQYYERVLTLSPPNATIVGKYQQLQQTIAQRSVVNSDQAEQRIQKQGLRFSIPVAWQVNEAKSELTITSPQKDFSITMRKKIFAPSTIEAYLAAVPKLAGQLLNQGPALIPQFHYAEVLIWRGSAGQLMQFFLFTKNQVIEVIVQPADSSHMTEFDQILKSLQVDGGPVE